MTRNTDTTLDFEPTQSRGCYCGPPEEVATYRGYTIRAVYDQSPMNPFLDWYGEPPLVAYHDRTTTEYGLDLDVPELTREQIKANIADIKRELETPTLLRAVDHPHWYGSDAVDLVNEAINDHASSLYIKDRMDFLTSVYSWKGIPAKTFTVTGYSQGDWAHLLIVLTPEWCQRVGANPERAAKEMEGTIDLYRWWAFGDVYGYIVEDPDGEEIDSCWGFYGPHDQSGLEAQAKDAIDYDIQRRRDARTSRLKTLIRNHVPLDVRAAKLAH